MTKQMNEMVEIEAGHFYLSMNTVAGVCRALGITADTTDQMLERIAASEEQDAASNGIRLTGTMDALLDYRDYVTED